MEMITLRIDSVSLQNNQLMYLLFSLLPHFQKEDDTLFTVPSDLIITVDFVETRSEISETINRYYERYADRSEYDPVRYEALALWLIYHAFVIDNSPWLPWLDIL
jgi:hypothetical protein